MSSHLPSSIAFAFALALSTTVSAPLWSQEEPLLFERDIRPIFRAHCFDCHGATADHEGQLDLRQVRLMRHGGESGPAIQPGNPDESLLLERIKIGEMPPGQHRVPDEQVQRLERWIAQGAKTARVEAVEIEPGLGITEEEREYWFFQPIQRPPIPHVQHPDQVRTPIDAFVLAKLEEQELSLAPEAERATLIRRAYLDLIGLAPTPSEVSDFVQDTSPDAWDNLIDHLLDSPHYGERWGRHWLDVAGYADSEGDSRDTIRPWAYRYRDWVIQALNRDLPFDEFIRMQIAGDEQVSPPYRNLQSGEIERLTASGFLRMAADGTAAQNDEATRNQLVADTIKILSSSLLGVSVHCAQCHDHRYDPISQRDYFRLRAILEPALNYKAWRTPTQRRISLYSDEEIVEANRIEGEAQQLEAARKEQERAFMDDALKKELEKFPVAIREPLEKAYRTDKKQRTETQNALLAQHPSVGNLHPGVLYQYNKSASDKLKEMSQKIAKLRSEKPPEHFIRALTEPHIRVDELPETRLFHRGDYRQPLDAVMPGGLTIAAPPESPFYVNDRRLRSQRLESNRVGSSGRRTAYARWLTSGRHPLVARVLVNRFWLHHFGKTFVSTPDEFGKLGTLPTHTKLLDWLADQFMRDGWSLKRFHRLVMRSTVYRQAARASDAAISRDAANQWYSRFPIHRLEAEVIRDVILQLSGRLDDRQFGPAADVKEDFTGQVVASGERQRRSVYLQVRRTKPVALLQSFDAPVMETNCAKRESSTVATQSLMLMNSAFVVESSFAYAKQFETQLPKSAREPLTSIWQAVYCRNPSVDELTQAAQYLDEQVSLLKQRGNESPQIQALANYIQILFSSNEFLYLD